MKKRVIIAGIGLLFQLIHFFRNKAKIQVKNHLLKIARELAQLSPTQLIKNVDKLQDYGLCVGKALASQKCKSILQPKKLVIISKLYQLKNFSFREDIQPFRKLIRIKRPSFFTLNDSSNSISILQSANLPIKTIAVAQRFNNVNKTSQLNFLIYLINWFRDINIPYISDSYYEQRYLPENATIAVLGKFKKQYSGKISCQKPILMGTSKQKILQTLQYKVSQLKIQKYLLILGISCCIVFLCKQLYKIYIKQKRKKQDPIQNYEKIIVKSRVCFNCKQKLSTFIFQNCGHLTMCKQCKQKIKICPQCKKNGQKGIQLYAC